MEGRMMGTVGGCLDILAYCVVSLARQSGDIPPGILMKLLERVKELDEKGVGKNDVLTNVQIPLSLLDVLVKKEKESEEQDDEQ